MPDLLTRIPKLAILANTLGLNGCITGTDINTQFELFHDHRIQVFFAPLELDYSPERLKFVKVFLVGMTPGRQQALEAFRSHFEPPLSAGDTVSFKGSMRSNFARIDRHLGLAQVLGLSSILDLFSSQQRHVGASTSLLKFPVFVKSKNYSGSPDPLKHPFLRKMILQILLPVLGRLSAQTLVIPLGTLVSRVLGRLCEDHGWAWKQHCLFGFPHLSGANNGGIAKYLEGSLIHEHQQQIRDVFLQRC
jgi:hypothetical protein